MLQVPALLFAIVVGILATAMQAPPRAPIVQAVDLAVPLTPVTFSQGGSDTILVYELHITNFQTVDVELTTVRVIAPIGTIAEYTEADLQRRLVRPGLRNDHPTPQILGPGMRAVLNLWIRLPFGLVPSITHEVELAVQRPAGAIRTAVMGGEVRVVAHIGEQQSIVIDPPLRKGPWIAIYDPLLKGGHRTAIYTVDGRARIPGRYAIDFIAMPAAGALQRDITSRPADGNGFGTDVIAVADGVIAAAVDDLPDQTPPPVTPENGSGNYVALEIADGRFAFYEHLQHGSIVVKAGQRVTRGQVIGKLGSSGSTSIGPHLHFHVADRNSLLGAEGVPFTFSLFTALGEFASIQALQAGEHWFPSGSARGLRYTRPSPNSVITFP